MNTKMKMGAWGSAWFEIVRSVWDKLLKLLRVEEARGGIEITDTALRLVLREGEAWKFYAVKLPPGVLENGRVKDAKGLVAALSELRRKVAHVGRESHAMSVVVSLGGGGVYSQVFRLPFLEGESLERAVALNLEMASPLPSANTYSGWQLLLRDPDAFRLEVLGAFVERIAMDEVVRSLREAGFLPYVAEWRALSLTRLFYEKASGFRDEKPFVVLAIDASGIDYLLVKNGRPYFEYFHSWREVQGEVQELTRASFEAAIVRNLEQVLHFSRKNFEEPLTRLLLVSRISEDQIIALLKERFSLVIERVNVEIEESSDPEWFTALGAGMRTLTPLRLDHDISLLGITPREEFLRAQLLTFLRFWRLAIPIALAILLVAFLVTDFFLMRTLRSLEEEMEQRKGSGTAFAEIQALQTQIDQFNQSVMFLRNVEGTEPKIVFFEQIMQKLNENNIRLYSFQFESPNQPVQLMGEARAEENILQLKKSLENAGFESVYLPLTQIKRGPEGVSFVLSFSIASSKTE